MCYSVESSKRALIFGILCGLALMGFGDEKYKDVNRTMGCFFIFVSLMQYVEYLIWTDTKCVNGNNKLAGSIGPLLNYLQPAVLFVFILIFLNKQTSNDNMIPITLNICYVMYILYKYYVYRKKDKICSYPKDGHLVWAWINHYDYILYNIVMIFNILYFCTDASSRIALGVSYFYFLISMLKFNEHMPAIWCYTVTSVPLIVLLYQKFMA